MEDKYVVYCLFLPGDFVVTGNAVVTVTGTIVLGVFGVNSKDK